MLRPRLTGLDHDVTWVTEDTPQSRSLLAGEHCVFVPGTEPRNLAGAFSYALDAQRILGCGGWERVVSTGALVAVPFLMAARVHGIESHFIESAARVDRPSLAARLLEWIPGVHRYSQYEACYPGRRRTGWIYGGSVFDSFTVGGERHRPVERMVVTLGTSTYSFRRLVNQLLEVTPPHVEVVWQVGGTSSVGLPPDARVSMPADVLFAAMQRADLVIAHAGVGSALNALKAGHRPVLVPRLRLHGEHVDDHQVQIADELGRRGLSAPLRVEEITWSNLTSGRRQIVGRSVPPAFALTSGSDVEHERFTFSPELRRRGRPRSHATS